MFINLIIILELSDKMSEKEHEKSKRATDSGNLATRRQANENFAQSDFDGWIFDNLNIEPGNSILDVGCGDGKHLFRSLQLASPNGSVIGIDISQESLDKCRDLIKQGGLKNINVKFCDLTNIGETFPPPVKFDRIYSSYAIYYTKDANKTLSDCYNLLNDGGILFLCGPTEGSNWEFIELAQRAGCRKEYKEWSGFLEREVGTLRSLAGNVEVTYFKNKIVYPSEAALFDYWKSTQLYNKELEEAMRIVIAEEFKKKDTFSNTKITIGLRCLK